MRIFSNCLLFAFLLLYTQSSFAQEKFTISGYVKDKNTGETLIAANVFVKSEQDIGAFTNTYGFYSLSLEEGNYTLIFTYLGFSTKEVKIQLDRDIQLTWNSSKELP